MEALHFAPAFSHPTIIPSIFSICTACTMSIIMAVIKAIPTKSYKLFYEREPSTSQHKIDNTTVKNRLKFLFLLRYLSEFFSSEFYGDGEQR